MMQRTEVLQTARLQLVLAWSVAGIPLLAGVAQTLVNAMKLSQYTLEDLVLPRGRLVSLLGISQSKAVR